MQQGYDLQIMFRPGPLGSNTLGEVPEDKYEFDEGAAQVQRLLQRDRKELTGIEEIGAGFKTEFDEGDSSEKEEEAATSTSGRSNGSTPTAGSSVPHVCMLMYSLTSFISLLCCVFQRNSILMTEMTVCVGIQGRPVPFHLVNQQLQARLVLQRASLHPLSPSPVLEMQSCSMKWTT